MFFLHCLVATEKCNHGTGAKGAPGGTALAMLVPDEGASFKYIAPISYILPIGMLSGIYSL